MPKALRIVLALSLTALLFVGLAIVVLQLPVPDLALAEGTVTYHTLRVYGHIHEGAGDTSVVDLVTGRRPEDPPYTRGEPIFNPQLWQAPIKDSVTWNPLWMSEFETFDENWSKGLYNKIFAGSRNATEKVWFRMWYEPWHWDKDLNASDGLDIHPDARVPYTDTRHDESYPAIMQEFTYLLMEPEQLSSKPEPISGPAGQTTFVFPVGIRKDDLFTPGGQVDTSSINAQYGYGLTSLDGDFDGVPDIVHVESELTLLGKTAIAADFDGNGFIDPLELDGDELTGDELAIFRLDTKAMAVNRAIQFLDHMAIVKAVFDDSVLLEVWYTGDMVPVRLGTMTLFVGDMLLSGRNGPGQAIRAVANGGSGTNMCNFPTGPWFAFLESIDTAEDTARLMVGRALGATYSAMEDSAFRPDVRPGDPWFLKRFYVDGHEYNVVAIKTVRGAYTRLGDGGGVCTLDSDDNDVVDPPFTSPRDESQFKFITIRTPIPKTGEYDDPRVGHLIEQHSVRLQPYFATDYLSVMPPYNYEHYIILDVQAIEGFFCDEDDVAYIGPLVGPVPPILQKNGPFPYTGVGPNSPYNSIAEMALYYVAEAKNEQFLGELKEKYGEITDNVVEQEYWYVEQFHTLPWEYTEFVLPNLGRSYTGDRQDLYLLTSAFQARQSEYILWTQDVPTDTTSAYNLTWDPDEGCWIREAGMSQYWPAEWDPRVKFWFDPAVGGKKYKDASGLRIYGLEDEGPGNPGISDRPWAPTGYPVEVFPYTRPEVPFNPDLPQAPPKDSVTFNPAYMDKFYNSGESLVSLYEQLSIRELDAREKVFLRMWYEPEYLDKILRLSADPPYTPTATYTFPAVMQEFTYMYVDAITGKPSHAQPGSSAFAFPMATGTRELPKPDGGVVPSGLLPSFGYGLTTFDANFDGQHDIVHVHSERSLARLTGIDAEFDGDGTLDRLDDDGQALSGDELIVFALEDMLLHRGESVQFLDHMVTLDNVSPGRALLKFWYTGGGLHPVGGGQYSLHPDSVDTRTLQTKQMAIVKKTGVARVLSQGENNYGFVDGPWFVFVQDVNSASETASLMIGRALGHTYTAMDNGAGLHDLEPGDPWYLKRFFVDGHEYNVVALHTVPATPIHPEDEPFEFKYITIRTPVPKVNFVNYEDSQKLEGYYLGTVFGVDTSIISVMPPFNFEHTGVEDVQTLPEKAVPAGGTVEEYVFDNEAFYDEDCHGPLLKDKPPYRIRIVDEDTEPQFFGELKEKYHDDTGIQLWQVEQWHTLPDEYTELSLPTGQKYLLTSDWVSPESLVNYYRCVEEPETLADLGGLAGQSGAQSSANNGQRVKFWYDPADSKDLYVNTWAGPEPPTPTPTPTPTKTPTLPPGATGSVSGVVRLQGRTIHSGVAVSADGVNTTTDINGHYTLNGVPAGTRTVTAAMPSYLSARKTGVVVNASTTTTLPDVLLLGGDVNSDGIVNLFDLVHVAGSYGSTPPSYPRADINGNGTVDIFDLVMVGANLDKVAPTPWVASVRPSVRIAAVAQLTVSPAHVSAEVDELFTVTLQLDDVSGLYGADIQLAFDPTALEVVDADPGTDGVQVSHGTLLDPAKGQVGENRGGNAEGTVDYAIALVSPAEAVSGSGVLCAITFRAKALGDSALEIISAELTDENADPILVVWESGEVHVGPQMPYGIWLPLIVRGGQPR